MKSSFFPSYWGVVHTSLVTPPFQKVCDNRRVANIIISLTSDVHCNVCRSKPKDVKYGFLCATILTSKKHMLLTIEGKWLKTIVHMIEFTFWLCLVKNKFSYSSPFGFVVNFIYCRHLTLLVFTKILNNFC
jgi:mRNA-degrading endonuclease HigB of HigAB toxin-antitoxin module